MPESLAFNSCPGIEVPAVLRCCDVLTFLSRLVRFGCPVTSALIPLFCTSCLFLFWPDPLLLVLSLLISSVYLSRLTCPCFAFSAVLSCHACSVQVVLTQLLSALMILPISPLCWPTRQTYPGSFITVIMSQMSCFALFCCQVLVVVSSISCPV